MMNLKTKVAVTGVSNLHDARYCAGMGVDWVAFPIDATLPNHVSKEDFAEIIGWVTGPLFFGEVSQVAEVTISDFQVDGLLTDNEAILEQFGGEMPVAWKISAEAKSNKALEEELASHDTANWFLLEASAEWMEEQMQWLKTICQKHPIILAADFDPAQANQIIDHIAPLGIGLKGGKELKVGLNNFDGLADVLEAIELEDWD